MLINHLFILQTYSQPNFCFLISGWCKKFKGEVDKSLGMANYNIYFKNNVNRLVMNMTQTNFSLQTKCVYITD